MSKYTFSMLEEELVNKKLVNLTLLFVCCNLILFSLCHNAILKGIALGMAIAFFIWMHSTNMKNYRIQNGKFIIYRSGVEEVLEDISTATTREDTLVKVSSYLPVSDNDECWIIKDKKKTLLALPIGTQFDKDLEDRIIQ